MKGGWAEAHRRALPAGFQKVLPWHRQPRGVPLAPWQAPLMLLYIWTCSVAPSDPSLSTRRRTSGGLAGLW